MLMDDTFGEESEHVIEKEISWKNIKTWQLFCVTINVVRLLADIFIKKGEMNNIDIFCEAQAY